MTGPAPGSAIRVFTLVGGGGRVGSEVSLRTGNALVEWLSLTPGAGRKGSVCKAFVNTPFLPSLSWDIRDGSPYAISLSGFEVPSLFLTLTLPTKAFYIMTYQ